MKTEIERRPVWLLAIGLAIGYSTWIQPPHALFLLAALAIFRSARPFALIAAGFALGLVLWPRNAVEPAEGGPFRGTVTVVDVPKLYPDEVASTVSFEGRLFRMTWSESDIGLGDQLDVEGTVRSLRRGPDDRLLEDGIVGRIRADRATIVSRGPPLFQAGSKLRGRFVDLVGRSMDPFEANVALALCFNVDSGLPDDVREDLRRSGTIHIISASGVHVLIYAATTLFLLSLLPIPRHWQIVALILILLIYAAAAGFRPPIVRSVGMTAILLGAYLVRREPDLFNALGVVLLGYLLLQPNSIRDIGFQLSFVTVGALALFGRWTPGGGLGFWSSVGLNAKETALASVIATVASGPIVAYHFGSVSLIAVLSNLAIAILVGPILILCMLALGLNFVWPAAASGILSTAVQPLIDAMIGIVQRCGQLPFAAIDVPMFSPYWLIPYYAFWLLIWRKRERPA